MLSSSLASRAQEAWNEWEIQCLVMASFSLQVFLLLSAPFRRRHVSRLLNGSLWVAYLMADYVATYILGRLTLLLAVTGGNEGTRHHQLALFWAPFLLLHLGGQETITAFSMEDNTLWKRRLLDLIAQVAMSVYVVGKQWRQGDRLLVAPMVLMFVLGAVKYGERIWALRAAAARAPGSSSIASLVTHAYWKEHYWKGGYGRLVCISSQDKISIESILKEASVEFQASLDFFMDMTPSDKSISSWMSAFDMDTLLQLKTSKNVYGMAYKLAEMHVSLIYDYLYTKFGTVRFHASPKSNPTMVAALQWLVSLGLTSVALALFAMAMAGNTTSNFDYSESDILISYILLKRERRQQTSPGGAVGALIRRILQAPCETPPPPHIIVSPEVKKLLLDKMFVAAIEALQNNRWDFRRFQGQWALWVANRFEGSDAAAGPAHKALSSIQKLDFVATVVVWHLVTTICFQAGDGPGELTNPSNDLSGYIMYLVAKRGLMVDSNGHIMIAKTQMGVPDFLDELHQDGFIQKLREGDQQYNSPFQLCIAEACMVRVELFKIPEARDRWKLIAAVWTEILCYMALNCGATFHAKHLTAGGEFLTQAKMLLFVIRLPFLIKKMGVIIPPFM
ncbi:hypothetical protein OsI_00001 [Oryza sativa Indica Group]|uniref:DUF4220 domain-containing protein n=1 Tax=Oryza sativa subsp. indica TaxID=39946 RepID=B8ACQ9_ORYSI|nr:hypothetical protein OsI_00001 [Oryza sativa Indica Group]